MKPEEILEFSPSSYAARIAQSQTQELREKELVKTRQILKAHAGVSAGTIHAVATGGLTVFHPIYAGRAGDVATAKLQIIQSELTRRGIPLHRADSKDNEAALTGFLVGEMAGDAAEGAFPAGVPEGSLGPVAADFAAGEVAEDGVAEETDKLGPEASGFRCSRTMLRKNERLRCRLCGGFFDASFTEYLRKSSCEKGDECVRC